MVTDVDVQYFSHMNGLTLGNNWGDLIRLLDKALVAGIDFTQITAASIDAQGDVHITLYSTHKAMLFQVVELTGFTPVSFNQKYRIKGIPSTTELILKPQTVITETSIATVGSGKLASLGYEIIFRDTNDVERVYRAKNPTTQHPFIRVDETISDGVNSYDSAYAKYAMVGLLEHMDHIDDYQNPDVLQLPFNTSEPAKNWKIKGTGASVIRGWSRWYWNKALSGVAAQVYDTGSTNRSTGFTLVGDSDCFYFLRAIGDSTTTSKVLSGCGLYNSCTPTEVIPNWFLMTALTGVAANNYQQMTVETEGSTPLVNSDYAVPNYFFTPAFNMLAPLTAHVRAQAIVPDNLSGNSNFASSLDNSGLEVPFKDTSGYLRGTLKHLLYACKNPNVTQTTPKLADTSMYVTDAVNCGHSETKVGAFYFYLGGLE